MPRKEFGNGKEFRAIGKDRSSWNEIGKWEEEYSTFITEFQGKRQMLNPRYTTQREATAKPSKEIPNCHNCFRQANSSYTAQVFTRQPCLLLEDPQSKNAEKGIPRIKKEGNRCGKSSVQNKVEKVWSGIRNRKNRFTGSIVAVGVV